MINPVFISIGNFQIRYFGLLFGLGLLFLFQMIRANLKKAGIGITRDELLDWYLITFFYAIIGARIYYVLFNLKFYFKSKLPWYEFLAIWHGGLATSGGFLFAIFAIWILCSQKQIRFSAMVDQIAPPLFLIQAIIRLGNFINGEVHGLPTQKALGIVFRYGPAADHHPGVKIHPVMLYEALFCMFAFLLVDQFRRGRFEGGLTSAVYLLLFSVIRIFSVLMGVEEMMFLGIGESMVLGSGGIILSLGFIAKCRLYRKRPLKKRSYTSRPRHSLKG